MKEEMVRGFVKDLVGRERSIDPRKIEGLIQNLLLLPAAPASEMIGAITSTIAPLMMDDYDISKIHTLAETLTRLQNSPNSDLYPDSVIEEAPKNLIYIIDKFLGEIFPKETLDNLLEIVHSPGETLPELKAKLRKLNLNFEKALKESPLVEKWGNLFPEEVNSMMELLTPTPTPTPTIIDFDSRRNDDGICVVTDIIEVEKLVGGARGDIIKVIESNRGLGVDDPTLLPVYLIVTDKMPEGDAILADPDFKLTKKAALAALKKKGM
jgi:hypothetical protein